MHFPRVPLFANPFFPEEDSSSSLDDVTPLSPRLKYFFKSPMVQEVILENAHPSLVVECFVKPPHSYQCLILKSIPVSEDLVAALKKKIAEVSVV